MLSVLYNLETELNDLLYQPEIWQSMDIIYDKPHVERVWCRWNQYRVNLYVSYPCKKEEAFLHPHPWASAVKILSGKYEMLLGYGIGEKPPAVTTKMVLTEGSAYEMTHIDLWHSIRPLGGPVISLMVTDAPWDRGQPKVLSSPLSIEAKEYIFSYFTSKYRKT